MTDPDARQRFLPDYHIRSGQDFRRAFHRRCRAGDGWLTVVGCENGLGHPRLGLVVSRKLGKATVRNRWKRLLREAFRLMLRELPAGVDLVVIPRPGVEPGLAILRESLPRLARQVARKLNASAGD